MDKLLALLHSRRFWISVAGLIVAVAGENGLELDPEVVNNAVIVIAAWVVGDSLKSTELGAKP